MRGWPFSCFARSRQTLQVAPQLLLNMSLVAVGEVLMVFVRVSAASDPRIVHAPRCACGKGHLDHPKGPSSAINGHPPFLRSRLGHSPSGCPTNAPRPSSKRHQDLGVSAMQPECESPASWDHPPRGSWDQLRPHRPPSNARPGSIRARRPPSSVRWGVTEPA